jgi:hypothetical protein
VRRALFTLASSLLALVAGATPAGAVDSSNFQTRLHAVQPRPQGIEVRVIEIGNRLELVNRTNTEVVVLGYEEEPYLRVGPAGVFENRRSPATYLNRDRQATSPVPEDADPTAPPEWTKVSSSRTARWYDHRVHWMGAILPPTVRQEPGERHVVIPEWTVTFRHGNTPFMATGELAWVPGPSPAPWLMLAILPVGGAFLLVGTLMWSGVRSWWPRPIAAAALLLVALTALAAFGREPPRVHPVLALSWLGAVVGAVLLVRRRRVGLYVTVLASAGIASFAGIALLGDLSRSQLPSGLPDGLARGSVAVAIGLSLAIVATSLLASRRASSGDSHLLSEP